MGSFTDLNTYAQTTLTFTDSRDRGIRYNLPIVTDSAYAQTATSGSFTITRLMPNANVNLEVTEIRRPSDTQFYLQVDVSSVSGATVTWSSTGTASVSNPSTGVYKIGTIDDLDTWDLVKSATINLPATFNGVFEYTVSLIYYNRTGLVTDTYTVGTFVPVAQLSVIAQTSTTYTRLYRSGGVFDVFATATSALTLNSLTAVSVFDFSNSTTTTVTGTPSIDYPEGDGTETWTVVVTPQYTGEDTFVSSLSSSGSGGTSTWDGSVLEITGTETEVESHLNNISLTATGNSVDGEFLYSASVDSIPDFEFYQTQEINNLNNDRLCNKPRGTVTYTTAVASLIGPDGYNILDPDYTGSGTYTLTITPSDPSQVSLISSTGITRWGTEQSYTYTVVSTGGLEAAGYAADSDFVVLGNPTADDPSTDAGTLHVFTKSGTTYSRQSSVISGVSGTYRKLGDTVVVDDTDLVIASAPGVHTGDPNDPVGRVYVFEVDAGYNLVNSVELAPPDLADDSWFGLHISCSQEGTLLIAEPTDVQTGETRPGRFHVYTRSSGAYSRATTVIDPDADTSTSFAWEHAVIAATGDRIMVLRGLGLASDEETYIYSGSGSSWSLDEKIQSHRFGQFTSDGTRYIYGDGTDIYCMARQSGGSWTQQTSFTPSIGHDPRSLRISQDDSKVILKKNTSQTDFEFVLIDFNSSTNVFTEDTTFDVDAQMSQYNDHQINHDGTEIIVMGNLENGDRGFVTFTYAPKYDYNSSTGVYTQFGTKTEVNADIETIQLTSASGETDPIELVYSLNTPEAIDQSRTLTAVNT